MDPRLWTVTDKTGRRDGPWQQNPTRWRDPPTGYPCILRRGPWVRCAATSLCRRVIRCTASRMGR
jgi:hypothetical protein